MSIDLASHESPVTSSNQLKISQQEFDYLQSFLDLGDRGGYYMALYNMTGNEQCIEQAQIATFSEGSGGVAYGANVLLQLHLAEGEYPGIYFLSQEVAEYKLDAGALVPLVISPKVVRIEKKENSASGLVTHSAALFLR